MEIRDEFESDWIHSVFEVLREEVVSIAADFGDRVKGEIDQVAAAQGVRPPSAAALLTAVAIESGNITAGLLRRDDAAPGADDDDDNSETSPKGHVDAARDGDGDDD